MKHSDDGIESAYIYLRVPNDNSDNIIALKAHLHELRKMCSDRNVRVLRSYHDFGSGIGERFTW